MELLGQWVRVPLPSPQLESPGGVEPYLVIDEFFAAGFAEKLAAAFPVCSPWSRLPWERFCNPLEVKFELRRELPEVFEEAYGLLASSVCVQALQRCARLYQFAADVSLESTGLCSLPRFGRVHKHAVCGGPRAWKLIVYLSPAWCEEWGGDLTFHGGGEPDVQRIAYRFNRAVFYPTDRWSSVAGNVACPLGTYFQTLSCLYKEVECSAPELRARRTVFASLTPFQRVFLSDLYRVRTVRLLDVADLPGAWAPGSALDLLLQMPRTAEN